MEQCITDFIAEKKINCGEVYVRNVLTENKSVPIADSIKNMLLDNHMATYDYKSRAVFVFQKCYGQNEICFFAFFAQEYAERRQVYLSYLDSVNFFHPKEHRSSIYKVLILSYMEFVCNAGFMSFHLWACPPQRGMDYIFHKHPQGQRYPSKKRLVDWYKAIFDEAVKKGIVSSWQNLHDGIDEHGLNSIAQIPLFDGDFWPDAINLCFANRCANGFAKLNELLKKNNSAFLVAKFRVESDTITSNEPLRTCTVVKDRANLIQFAFEQKLEFSTIRRAKFSTKRIIQAFLEYQQYYICSICAKEFVLGFNCDFCLEYNVCSGCYSTMPNHAHELSDGKGQNKHSVFDLLNGLLHANKCIVVNCQVIFCSQLRLIIEHTEECVELGCQICWNYVNLCAHHSICCHEANCSVGPCRKIKLKYEIQQQKARYFM